MKAIAGLLGISGTVALSVAFSNLSESHLALLSGAIGGMCLAFMIFVVSLPDECLVGHQPSHEPDDRP